MSNLPLPTRAPSSAEIEAARQLLERIYHGPSASGALAGNAAAQQAGGLLIKGASTALLTAGIWVSMQEPAGLPVLQEHLMLHGPRGFFDQMERMLQEKGGDTQAVRALRTTVMGMLDNGQVHSAGLILGQTLAEAQRGGLISQNGDPMDMGISAALRYSQQHPPQAPVQAPSAGVPTAPAPLAASLNTAPQPPALTRELQGLRDRINSGQYANSSDAYDQGIQAFNGLVEQVNALRRAGTQTVDDRSLQIAQDELTGRRTNSILGQYLRNAENGGPLPSGADMDRYMGQVRQFNETTRERYGRPMFDPAGLDRIEQRLDRTIAFREDMRGFLDRATSGQYANSAQRYEQGTSELEQLRIRSNALAGEGLRGMSQQDYDRSLLQLEGRRINSVMSYVGDQLQQGRPIDPQITESLVDRAQSLNARSRAGGYGDFFDAGTLDTYGDRNATARFRQDYREFNAQVLSGEFANSDERYRQGQARLQTLVDGANRVLSERGVQPLPQGTLDETGFQLEGRRINSQLSHLQREAEQGRSIDPERTRALLEQAESLNTRRSEAGRGDFFDAQTMREYRELQRNAPQAAAPPAVEPAPGATPPGTSPQTPPATAPTPSPETPAPQTPAPQAPGTNDPDTPPANRPEAPQRDIEREWQEEFGGGELSEQLRREADRQGVSQEDVVDHARRNPSKTANEILADVRDGQLSHGGTPPGNRPPGSSVAAPGEPDDTPPLDNLTIVRPAPGTQPTPPANQDPMSAGDAPYGVDRATRMREPQPVVLDGVPYEIRGTTANGELRLAPQGERTRLMPESQMTVPVQRADGSIEREGRLVTYNGETWRFDSLQVVNWTPGADRSGVRLVDPRDPERAVVVPTERMGEIHVRLGGTFGDHTIKQETVYRPDGQDLARLPGREYSLADMRHGVLRLELVNPQGERLYRPEPGFSFEARSARDPLEGVKTWTVLENGQLSVEGPNRQGVPFRGRAEFSDVAPTSVTVQSPDFQRGYQVDSFFKAEQDARATSRTSPDAASPLRDPTLGVSPETARARLLHGAESLEAQAQFIRDAARDAPPGSNPTLTVFNIGFNNGGEAGRVIEALRDFRTQHPGAEINVVMYGPSMNTFANTPDFPQLQRDILAIGINRIDYSNQTQTTAQVIHAKGIAVRFGDAPDAEARALLTTAAIIPRTAEKSDLTIELTGQQARAFNTYVDGAMLNRGDNAFRVSSAAENAANGVLINDPQARLPYISRGYDAVIRGAQDNLFVSVSEIRNPETAQLIADRAAQGVRVQVQYREIDAESLAILQRAQQQHPDRMSVENVKHWDPKPHGNVAIADDGRVGIFATAYLWPNQQTNYGHARSLETGVLFQGESAREILREYEALRERQRERERERSDLPGREGSVARSPDAPALDPRATALLADSRSALDDMNRRVGVNPPAQVTETLAPQVAQQAYAAGFNEVARTDLNASVRQGDGSVVPAGTQLIASDGNERRVVLNIAEALQKTPEQAQSGLVAQVGAANAQANAPTRDPALAAAQEPERQTTGAMRMG